MHSTHRNLGAAGGFSLTELLLAMGLFSMISIGLVSLLSRSSDFLTAGRSSAETMDAIQTFTESFGTDVETIFTANDAETGRPAVRLFSDHVECDVDANEKKDARIQRLFFTRMIPREATAPVTRHAGTKVGAEAVMDQVTDLAEAEEGRLRSTGGLMDVFWVAVPDDAADPAVATLYRGYRSPIGGPDALFPDGATNDPGTPVEEMGPVDAAAIKAVARPVLSGILYFGVQFWSRKTTTWDDEIEPSAGGPLHTWDSTRGILRPLARRARYDGFALAKGFESFADPTDDTYPRRMRVTLVVEQVDNVEQNMFLMEDLSSEAQYVAISDVRKIPAADTDKRFVKIGGEWIEFTGTDGNALIGCKRGARGTLPTEHRSRAIVHYGRTVIREYTVATFRDTYQDDIPAVGGRR